MGLGAAAAVVREVAQPLAPVVDELARIAAPELADVASRYVPRFGSMSVDDVARGRALVHDALAGMQVVPVVNRWTRPGIPATVHSDIFMGTVHTLEPRNVADRMMRVVRTHWERARSMFGPGELAGQTVFASAQFVPRGAVERHGGDVVGALGELAAARGRWGVPRFGDNAHVLDPRVLARASASGRDSGLGLSPARLAPMDRFDDVVLERLARSHGFQRDPFTGANGYRLGIDGAGPAAERRASFRALLHDTPNDVAVERLRAYLAGPTMTDLDHMVELQVRAVPGRDVLATVREAAAANVDAVGI